MAVEQTIPQVDSLSFGLVGFVLILMWKVLEVGKQLFLANKVSKNPGIHMTPLACQIDPLHFQHIKEIHQNSEGIQDMVKTGELGCQWKSREEVRDYIDISKKQVTAIEAMVSELRLLRQEMVLTRNGKS